MKPTKAMAENAAARQRLTATIDALGAPPVGYEDTAARLIAEGVPPAIANDPNATRALSDWLEHRNSQRSACLDCGQPVELADEICDLPGCAESCWVHTEPGDAAACPGRGEHVRAAGSEHPFVRPGQVNHLPVPDQCMVCGLSAADHQLDVPPGEVLAAIAARLTPGQVSVVLQRLACGWPGDRRALARALDGIRVTGGTS